MDKINFINEKVMDRHIAKVIILYNNDDLLDNKSLKSIKNYLNNFSKLYNYSSHCSDFYYYELT